MCRFSAGGSRLKAYIYEASVAALPVRTLLACFCIVMSVVGEIIFLCFHGTDGKMVGFVVFVLLNMVEFAASLLIRRRIQAMRWMKMVI
jgi:hypothetical protein